MEIATSQKAVKWSSLLVVAKVIESVVAKGIESDSELNLKLLPFCLPCVSWGPLKGHSAAGLENVSCHDLDLGLDLCCAIAHDVPAHLRPSALASVDQNVC